MKIKLLDYDEVVKLDRFIVIVETLLAFEDSKALPKDTVAVLLQARSKLH
jgi:hypothetical protein